MGQKIVTRLILIAQNYGNRTEWSTIQGDDDCIGVDQLYNILYVSANSIWNSLPILITALTSFSIFKKKMIEFLMN